VRKRAWSTECFWCYSKLIYSEFGCLLNEELLQRYKTVNVKKYDDKLHKMTVYSTASTAYCCHWKQWPHEWWLFDIDVVTVFNYCLRFCWWHVQLHYVNVIYFRWHRVWLCCYWSSMAEQICEEKKTVSNIWLFHWIVKFKCWDCTESALMNGEMLAVLDKGWGNRDID